MRRFETMQDALFWQKTHGGCVFVPKKGPPISFDEDAESFDGIRRQLGEGVLIYPVPVRKGRKGVVENRLYSTGQYGADLEKKRL